MLKLLYQFLKKKTHFCFDFIKKKRHEFSIRSFVNSFINRFIVTVVKPNLGSRGVDKEANALHPVERNNDNYLLNIADREITGKELDEYLKSLKPSMPLLDHDPVIKTMKIEWNTSLLPMDESTQIKEKLEEQIINKYVRYVAKHIFVLLQPNKHKILLNATTWEQLGTYQIPVGEQVLYRNPQQLENYLIEHLMGILVSYEANDMGDFTYFINNIDEKQYEELSLKIEILFKD